MQKKKVEVESLVDASARQKRGHDLLVNTKLIVLNNKIA